MSAEIVSLIHTLLKSLYKEYERQFWIRQVSIGGIESIELNGRLYGESASLNFDTPEKCLEWILLNGVNELFKK